MWGRIINATSKIWVTIFWLNPGRIIEKIKVKVDLFKYKTHAETTFE